MRQQMILGDFIFGLSRGFAYSSLIRNSDGGWSDLAIIASKPQSRQNGQKLEKLTFNGTAMYANGWSMASAVIGACGGSIRWWKPKAT